MKNKQGKENSKFKRGLVVFIIGIILLVFALITSGIFSKEKDSVKFFNEYNLNSNLTEDNLYVYASKEEILEILDKKTGVIMLGFPECPWCQSIVEVLNDAAVLNEVKPIYYYNIKNERDKLSVDGTGEIIIEKAGTNFYRELLKELSGFTDEYVLTDAEEQQVSTGKQRIFVPMVIFVKNGEVEYTHIASVEGHTNPKEPLTEEQQKELLDIYNEGFDLIK